MAAQADDGRLSGCDRALSQIASHVNEVIFMFTPDWREAIYVSPAYDRIWGRPAAEVYRDARSWMAAIVPEDRDQVATIIEGQSCGKVPSEISVEYRIRTPDGKVRWINGRTYPVRDEGGNVMRIAGIAADVTVRRDAEDRLRDSEKFLNNIFDCFQDGISVLDKDLNIVRVNHRMDEWYPHMKPLAGKKCYEVYHGRSVPCEHCPSLRAMDTGKLQTGTVKHEGEGNVLKGWQEIYAFPLKDSDGHVIGVIEHVRDVTERKRAEESLQFERSQLLNIFDSIDEVIYITDPVTNEILYANKAMQDKFGRLLVGGICYREIQQRDSPCEFCTNPVILSDKGKPYRWEFHNPTVGRDFLITDRIIKWPDGRDVRFEIAVDITERKQAEESLRLMQHMIDQAEDEASLAGPDGRFIYVNDAKCRSLGYTKEELLTKHIWDVDPDVSPVRWRLMWQELKEKHHIKQETLHRTKDGTIFPTEIWSTFLDFNGREYVCAFVRDIQERKRVEKSLKLTQFTMDRAGDMILWVAPDSRYVYVNEAACRAFGYTREELMSMSTFDTRPAWTDESWAAHWKEIKDRGSFTFEAMLRKKDGSFFPGEISVNYLVYNGKEYNCSFIRDITERKRAEEALMESERKFRALAETTKAGIVLYRDKKFVYVNPMLETISGYTKDELLAMNFWDTVHPEHRELVRGRGLARQRGKDVPSTYEFKLLTKQGETKWVELSATQIEYEGRPTIMSTVYDITERKQAEHELHDAKEQAELYLDLMGHDINNLNQISIGYLETALGTLKLDPCSRDLIARPLEAIEASSRLIANVRKLQQIKEGGLKFRKMRIADKLHEVIPRYGDAQGREIRIRCDADNDSMVMANDLLDDVFSNIIHNAIKHSTGRLAIDVHLSTAKVGDQEYAIIAIEDNGPGIPDELKERLFTRFERGNSRSGGKGLGLYLVRTLVEDFHGKVWVENRVRGDQSKGTRFVVMLPVA